MKGFIRPHRLPFSPSRSFPSFVAGAWRRRRGEAAFAFLLSSFSYFLRPFSTEAVIWRQLSAVLLDGFSLQLPSLVLSDGRFLAFKLFRDAVESPVRSR